MSISPKAIEKCIEELESQVEKGYCPWLLKLRAMDDRIAVVPFLLRHIRSLSSELERVKNENERMVKALEEIREEGDLAEYDSRTKLAEDCLSSLST